MYILSQFQIPLNYISRNFCWDVKILNENSENGKSNSEVQNGCFSLYNSKTQCLSPQRAVQCQQKDWYPFKYTVFKLIQTMHPWTLRVRKTEA